MNHHPERRSWAIAHLLLITYLVIALGLAALFTLAVGGVIAGIARFGTVSWSVWDQAMQIARWFALGVGFYTISSYLPLSVTHGQTRRNFMIQSTPFTVVAAVVLAALVTVGYALEGVLYRSMGWPQTVSDDRLFTAPDHYGLIFVSYVGQFAVWMIAGALIGAGYYRNDGWSLIAVVPAVLLILLAGIAVGPNGFPFIGNVFGIMDAPLAGALTICAGSFVAGVAMTWGLVREIPIRTATA